MYHLLSYLDSSYKPTGTATWYKSEDEFLSFALSPKFKYDAGSSVESNIAIEADIYSANSTLFIKSTEPVDAIGVYNVAGHLVYTSINTERMVML